MKHVLLTFVMLLVSLLTFGQNNLRELSQMPKDDQGRFPYWRCATVEVTNAQRAQNPKLPSDEQFENFMSQAIRLSKLKRATATTEEVMKIPVVVHVIHGGETVGQGSNISLAQIESQIEVLNEDFRRMEGTNGFNDHADGADTRIEFVLAQRDPQGNTLAEPGVDRVLSTDLGFSGAVTSNEVDNYIKPATYWDSERYLNMWTVTFEGGLLGYAQFPINSGLDGLDFEGYPSGAETDGVVMWYKVFGSVDKGSFDLLPDYSKGRTTTHEVGHWLGLRHIWGDDGCGYDDYCTDTPESDAPNYGCPTGHASCGSVDMIENYMDYSGDDCMNIFTQDQKDRMMAVLEFSPRRGSLLTSDVIDRTLVANFVSADTAVYVGQPVAFENLSSEAFTAWEWSFDGGTTIASTDENPIFTFDSAGVYDVTLTASYDTTSVSETKTGYVAVDMPDAAPSVAFVTTSFESFTGVPLQFEDQSDETVHTWEWTFEGGTPATSTEANPVVTYDSAGSFDVTLVVTNAFGSSTLSLPDLMQITNGPSIDAPESLTVNLNAGDSTTTSMTLSNTGDATLNYELDATFSYATNPTVKQIDFGNYVEKKGEKDTRKGHPVTSRKGSGQAGYYWIDSNDENGPAFEWNDIQSNGTSISLSDDSYQTVTLPFDFEFFGETKNNIHIGSNGILSFNTSGASSYSNTQLPNSSTPNDLIAGYWTDLNPSTNGTVHYLSTAESFIVQFTNVPRFGGDGDFTFQYILYPNGEIKLQYLTMVDDFEDLTIGVEDKDGILGMQVAFNAPFMQDSLAIMMGQEHPISFASETGSIEPGQSVDVDVNVSAKYLYEGSYNAEVLVYSNDPAQGEKSVPLTVNVDGDPMLEASDSVLAFGDTRTDYGNYEYVYLSNNGTAPVSVTASVDGEFWLWDDQFVVEPGQSYPLEISFNPQQEIDYTGTLTITSDAIDNPTITVALEGTGVMPPEVSLSQESVSATTYPQGYARESFTIENTGGSELSFYFQPDFAPLTTPADRKTGFFATAERTVKATQSRSLAAQQNANNAVQTTYGVPYNTTGMTWAGSDVYLMDYSSASVYMYDVQNDTSAVAFAINDTTTSRYSLAWDGEFLWTTTDGLNVAEGYTTAGTLSATFNLPVTATGVYAMAWDGEAFLVKDAFVTDTLYRVATDGTVLDSYAFDQDLDIAQLTVQGNTIWGISEMTANNGGYMTRITLENGMAYTDDYYSHPIYSGACYSLATAPNGQMYATNFDGSYLYSTQNGKNEVIGWFGSEDMGNEITLAPGESYTGTLDFYAEGLDIGNYEASLIINSNTPGYYNQLPVSLEVTDGTPPTAVVATESISSEQHNGETTDHSFTIENTGEFPLYAMMDVSFYQEQMDESARKARNVGFHATAKKPRAVRALEPANLQNRSQANDVYLNYSVVGMTWADSDLLYYVDYQNDVVHSLDMDSAVNNFEFALDSTGMYYYSLAWDGEYLWTNQVGFDVAQAYTKEGELVGSFDLPLSSSGYYAMAWDGEAFLVKDAFEGDSLYRVDETGTVLSAYDLPGYIGSEISQLTVQGDYIWGISEESASYGYMVRMQIVDGELVIEEEQYDHPVYSNAASYALTTASNNQMWAAGFDGLLASSENGADEILNWVSSESMGEIVEIAAGSTYTMDLSLVAENMALGEHKASVRLQTTDMNNEEIIIPITMEILNSAPVANFELDDIVLSAGESADIDITDLFSEPDGHTFEEGISANNEDLAEYGFTEGTLTVVAGNVQSTTTVTMHATDELGAEATVSFDVIVNTAPVAGTLEDVTLKEDESVTVDLSTVFSDGDDELTYEVSLSTGGDAFAELDITDATYTITGIGVGSLEATVTATDMHGETATVTHTITVEEFILTAENNQLVELTSYPNPVTNNLKVSLVNIKSDQVTYKIFDMSGRMVKTGEWMNAERVQTIDLSDVKRGTYVLRVTTDNQQITQKLIKQ